MIKTLTLSSQGGTAPIPGALESLGVRSSQDQRQQGVRSGS
jgi:hypothetical protein